MASRLLALFVLSLFAFGIGRVAPGDPAEILLRSGGDTPSAEAIALQRERMGLDKPVAVQYTRWVWRLGCCLDGGQSFQTARPIGGELRSRAGKTLLLASAAAIVSFALVIALAVGGAWRERRVADLPAGFLATVCVSVPSFAIGLVLIDLLAVRWRVLPSSGSSSTAHLALPAITLALATWPVPYRLLRAELASASKRDFLAGLRARGLTHRHIVLRHQLPFALRPCIHSFGASLSQLIAGSIVVETLFSWPGLGRWAVDAISRRDYPVLQAYVLIVGVLYIVANLATDLLHRRLDPRPSHA